MRVSLVAESAVTAAEYNVLAAVTAVTADLSRCYYRSDCLRWLSDASSKIVCLYWTGSGLAASVVSGAFPLAQLFLSGTVQYADVSVFEPTVPSASVADVAACLVHSEFVPRPAVQ